MGNLSDQSASIWKYFQLDV